jgi:hypothetical protein
VPPVIRMDRSFSIGEISSCPAHRIDPQIPEAPTLN